MLFFEDAWGYIFRQGRGGEGSRRTERWYAYIEAGFTVVSPPLTSRIATHPLIVAPRSKIITVCVIRSIY
jgi:hypothetical protein